MNYNAISKMSLFDGISEYDTKSMLDCLGAFYKNYEKNDMIYSTGEYINTMGLILSGSVHIRQNDIWGRESIMDQIPSGSVFAEAYACLPDEPMMVDVISAEKSVILFLNTERIYKTCPSSCAFHARLNRNLLKVMAGRNLNLTRKMGHITPRSLREKLMSYLSYQAIKQNSHLFEIPFNRQQLADYLCVDRSALSNELSKMQKEGLLTFHKNKFKLEEMSYGNFK